MSANIESMFSVKTVPWHKTGLVLNNPPTSEEAIVLAGMNWEVTKHDTFYSLGDGTVLDPIPIPGMFAMVRSDNNAVIGRVGKNFEPLQNKKAFEFFDPFVQSGIASYETAGVLGKGETVWILAKFNAPVNIGKDDELRQYLLLANGHDGSTNVLVQPTEIRVVCQNTLMASLGTGNVVRVKHCRTMSQNLDQIMQQITDLSMNRTYTFEAYELMAKTTIADADIDSFFASLWPEPTLMKLDKNESTLVWKIWNAKKDWFKVLLKSGQGTEKTWLKGTVWWLYNAVTEMVDHYLASSNRIKDKTSYILRGDGGEVKDRAFYRACKMVNTIRGCEAIMYGNVGIEPKRFEE